MDHQARPIGIEERGIDDFRSAHRYCGKCFEKCDALNRAELRETIAARDLTPMRLC